MQGVDRADRLVAHAEKDEEAGDLLGVVGEVLAGHDRLGLDHARRPGRPNQARLHPLAQGRVVPRHRPVGLVVDLGLGPVGGGGVVNDAGELLGGLAPDLLVVRADGPFQGDLLRNDVPRLAAADDAHRNHDRLPGVDLAAGDGLDRGHHVGGGHDRVGALPGHGRVRLLAGDRQAEVVHAGQQPAVAIGDLAGLQVRTDVQPENGRHVRIAKHAFFDHQLRASLFAFGGAFLGGLENELDGAGYLVAHLGQHLGRAQQDGRVGVVPARVHHARVLRGVGQPGLFPDGQRVHVRAQGHRGAGPGAPDQSHHAVVRHARLDLVHPHGFELLGHQGGGPLLAVGQLGMGVDVAAPRDHGRRDLLGQLLHLAQNVVGP